MSRPAIATLAGLAGCFVYLVAVLWLGDHVQRLHWTIQAIFYTTAGLIWVIPVRWLMYWAVGRRPG